MSESRSSSMTPCVCVDRHTNQQQSQKKTSVSVVVVVDAHEWWPTFGRRFIFETFYRCVSEENAEKKPDLSIITKFFFMFNILSIDCFFFH